MEGRRAASALRENGPKSLLQHEQIILGPIFAACHFGPEAAVEDAQAHLGQRHGEFKTVFLDFTRNQARVWGWIRRSQPKRHGAAALEIAQYPRIHTARLARQFLTCQGRQSRSRLQRDGSPLRSLPFDDKHEMTIDEPRWQTMTNALGPQLDPSAHPVGVALPAQRYLDSTAEHRFLAAVKEAV